MSNSGVYPFVVDTPATTLQYFRILTNDDDPTATSDPTIGEYKFLSDDSASALIALYNDEPRLAAARELETIAVSEALLRKWSSDDKSVDGAAVANALRQLAKQMRDEVIAGIALEDDFEIVPTGTTSFPFGDGEWVYEAELVIPYFNPLRYSGS